MITVKFVRCALAATSPATVRSGICQWLCGFILVLCTSWSSSYAQNIESFVASTGLDTNNCSTVALACRSFGHALTQTFSGGQITVLDAADYGVANIMQGISIVNDNSGTTTNASSGASVGGFTGMIYISAGSSDIVTLRGLVLNAATFGSPNSVGVIINNALRVNIENCTILSANGAGILVAPGIQPATLPPSINVKLQNTTINGNGAGVKIASTVATPLNVSIAGSYVDGNAGGGVRIDGGSGGPVNVAIADSSVSHNGGNALNVVSSTASVMVTLLRDVIGFNGGAAAQANGVSAGIVVNGTALLNNMSALSVVGGGRILTYCNNSVVGTQGSSFTGTASLQ
jgi:hypothetical protein